MFGLRRRGWLSIAGASTLVLASVAFTGGVGGASSSSSTITYTVHPIAVQATSSASAAALTPGYCVKNFGLACYTPAVFHSAYQIPWTIGGSPAGTGQQIAIIDAYGSPTVQSDLDTFDAQFGLPNTTVNVVYPGGSPTVNPLKNATQASWAEETSLDVQTAHALAPGATINLVIAASPAGNVLNNALDYVVTHHLGDVMSMSYGSPEAAIAGGGNNLQVSQADAIFQRAAGEGMSVFASSGDSGGSNGYASANASFPASDPYVTSVGGTDLFVKALSSPRSTNYGYVSEYTWNDSDPSTCPFGCVDGVFGATGGAPSSIFAAPSYQRALTGQSMRSISDVSFNASVYTATLIYLGFLGGSANGFYFFGGTSEAAPSWAAITADLNQAKGSDLGPLNPLLYAIASTSAYAKDFHDVTVGNDQLPFPSAAGFAAGRGYDMPTGLGTPIVTGLLASLAPGASYSLSQP